MKHLLIAAASALVLAACAPSKPAAPAAAPPAAEPAAAPAPAEPEVKLGRAGTYKMDLSHSSVTWRVMHMGLSKYTGRFKKIDATLVFNPADTAASGIKVTIDPTSIETDYPGNYKATHEKSPFKSWNDDLAKNEKWFNAVAHPAITFEATEITKVTNSTGKVTGNLTFLGVTKPVTLDVTYNGVAQMPWAPETDKIGFSAKTVIKRSEFGMSNYLPNIGDDVEVLIEAEFDEVKG